MPPFSTLRIAVIFSLITGLPGLVAAVINFVLAWKKDLNASARRLKMIEEATRRIEFWKTCSEVMKSLADYGVDLDELVQQELLVAKTLVLQTSTSSFRTNVGVAPKSTFRSKFLLYRIRGRRRIFQVYFWAYCVVVLFFPVLTSAYKVFGRSLSKRLAAWAIATELIALVLLLIFRWLAKRRANFSPLQAARRRMRIESDGL